MITLRRAALADLAAVVSRTLRFNLEEQIEIEISRLEAGTRRLIEDPTLGAIWLIEDGAPIGHAVVTYGYDLEYAGRDSFLTELWVDPEARGRGVGAAALELITSELRALDIQALHLQVRPDNPARRLYQRIGFEDVPRVTMTRRL